MEAVYSSESSVESQRTTRRCISEDRSPHNHICGNLKSCNPFFVFQLSAPIFTYISTKQYKSVTAPPLPACKCCLCKPKFIFSSGHFWLSCNVMKYLICVYFLPSLLIFQTIFRQLPICSTSLKSSEIVKCDPSRKCVSLFSCFFSFPRLITII
jgi:hypothetical protein